LVGRFHEAHNQAYGHALPGRIVEVVNLRLQAVGMVEKPVFEEELAGNETSGKALLGRKAMTNGEFIDLYEREALPIGTCFDGPALVFQLDSTVYVARGWSARVDGWRNLVVERKL
jgi:N-methylhydantoinase A